LRRSCVRPLSALVCIAALAGGSLLRADTPVLRDQSDFDPTGSFDITGQIVADNFAVASSTRVTRAQVWLADGVVNDNGVLDSFGGVLNYGIWLDSGGGPGLLSYVGLARNIVQVDTGQQDSSGHDIVAVSFQLTHPVALDSDPYWFGIHEGNFGENDGTAVTWVHGATVFGAGARSSTDLVEPESWTSNSDDVAFVLLAEKPIWDQGGVGNGALGFNITTFVYANDVTLGAATSFSSIELWLADGNEPDFNTVFDNFSGTLGWAIYSDAPGKPGSLQASGSTDAVDAVLAVETTVAEAEIYRVRADLGRTVTLGAGTWWLALRDGTWGEAGGSSSVYWCYGLSSEGGSGFGDADEAAPSTWSYSNQDGAFVLSSELLYASGFEAGGTCSWSNGGALDCP